TTVFRSDKNILNVNARASQEGGEIIKIQAKPDRRIAFFCKQGKGMRVWAEQVFFECVHVSSDFMLELFKFCEFTDQLKNNRTIFPRCFAYNHIAHSNISMTASLRQNYYIATAR